MRADRTFVTGEPLRVVVPDARALPDPMATAVLSVRRRELEINVARPGGLRFFLEATGSRLTGEVALAGGRTLRHGRLGNRARSGRVFAIDVGKHRVFGSCGPVISLVDLAGTFRRITFRDQPSGATLTPGAGLTWARRLPSSIAQVVDLGRDRGFLLDIRLASARAGRSAPGRSVEGGTLSRSGDDERVPYLVLEADRAVGYGLPWPGTPLDQVAQAMSRVRLEMP